MDNMQNNNMMSENKMTGGKKKVLATVITGLVVLGVLVWWLSFTAPKNSVSNNPSSSPAVDQNSDINKDLNNINIETPDFKSIDQNINSL